MRAGLTRPASDRRPWAEVWATSAAPTRAAASVTGPASRPRAQRASAIAAVASHSRARVRARSSRSATWRIVQHPQVHRGLLDQRHASAAGEAEIALGARIGPLDALGVSSLSCRSVTSASRHRESRTLLTAISIAGARSVCRERLDEVGHRARVTGPFDQVALGRRSASHRREPWPTIRSAAAMPSDAASSRPGRPGRVAAPRRGRWPLRPRLADDVVPLLASFSGEVPSGSAPRPRDQARTGSGGCSPGSGYRGLRRSPEGCSLRAWPSRRAARRQLHDVQLDLDHAHGGPGSSRTASRPGVLDGLLLTARPQRPTAFHRARPHGFPPTGATLLIQ